MEMLITVLQKLFMDFNSIIMVVLRAPKMRQVLDLAYQQAVRLLLHSLSQEHLFLQEKEL